MPDVDVDVDVVVVGAGPAGSCAALNLAPFHRTVVVDRQAVAGARLVESLPPVAGRLLADMGLLDSFLAEDHDRWQVKRSVWERPEPVEVDLLRDPDGLGWHLDRRRFGAWLRAVAVSRGATMLVPATVDAIGREGGGWRVDLATASGPVTLRVRAVVDAGGRRAPLAARLGVRRRRTDRLVCGWVEGRDSGSGGAGRSPGVTYVEAAPDGWWYTAGLADGRRLLAFHTDSDLEAAAIARDGPGLRAAARMRLGLASLLDDAGFTPGPVCGFDAAHSAVLDPCAGPGWLAAGDAALSFDPVSSRGLLNALVTGLAGAEAVDRHLAGAGDAFADYESMVAGVWHRYQAELTDCYRSVTRWPTSPFWGRRAPVMPTVPGANSPSGPITGSPAVNPQVLA